MLNSKSKNQKQNSEFQNRKFKSQIPKSKIQIQESKKQKLDKKNELLRNQLRISEPISSDFNDRWSQAIEEICEENKDNPFSCFTSDVFTRMEEIEAREKRREEAQELSSCINNVPRKQTRRI
jgi:hypothetical protein